MIQSLLLFLAPLESCVQATHHSPPARPRPRHGLPARVRPGLRFMAAIVGNAIGLGLLLAGCWLFLQLMQVFTT